MDDTQEEGSYMIPNLLIGLVMVVGTIVVYILSKKLYIKFPSPLLLPITVSIILIIVGLSLLHIPYDTYMTGGSWLSHLLGPGVVALAYPLYEHRKVLKKLAVPILVGTTIGALIGIFTGVGLASLAGFNADILYSISPKSVTTPVAVSIIESIGGIESLGAVFVMFAGVGGTMLSSFIFNASSITSPTSKSIGLGCASHVIGVTKAMESSQQQGAISTVTMILSAVFVSMTLPFILLLFI